MTIKTIITPIVQLLRSHEDVPVLGFVPLVPFVHAELFELVILQPGHDPVERVDLLSLAGSHQPGVLRPHVQGEDRLLQLVTYLPLGGAAGSSSSGSGGSAGFGGTAAARLNCVRSATPPEKLFLLTTCE